jgi:hypothetical protein
MGDPMDPTPEDHPAKDVVEDVAEDFSEVWEEADRLRRLVEEKLSRWTSRPDEKVKALAGKLTSLKDKLERALAEVDSRTDEVAGRFPRRPPQGPRHL